MSNYFVSPDLLKAAIKTLRIWMEQVPKQYSRHIWSILPLKLAGAEPGVLIEYQENDDYQFMDRFLKYGKQNPDYPYFDPFSQEWLPAGYPHSNLATFRKKTFARAWNACTWDGEEVTLSPDYGDIFANKALKKAGNETPVPALACAIWFFKAPQIEWPNDISIEQGIPGDAAAIIELFREKFNFNDDTAWNRIFDNSPDSIQNFTSLISDSPDASISASEISSVCSDMASPRGGIITKSEPSEADEPRRTVSASDIRDELESDLITFPKSLVQRITSALEHSHIRLIGPPGTGKSTLAKAILRSAAGDDHLFSVATSEWTNHDIVGGLAPDPSESFKLKFRPGLVLDAANRGLWVGIDEINRSDIDSAFGELFGLLSGFDIDLPFEGAENESGRIKIYSERPEGKLANGEYGLPRDWRMVATMNSWDKVSLNRVSFAFSRRWCTIFVPVPSSDQYDVIIDKFMAEEELQHEVELRDSLIRLFSFNGKINEPTLRSIGYSMGPGIAKSCVRDIAASMRNGESMPISLAYAIEGFLLPQFEGALSDHAAISDCLQDALKILDADEHTLKLIHDELGVFTGYNINSGF